MSQIPMLAFVVLAYNLLAFTINTGIVQPFVSITLFSGAVWGLSVGDLLLIAGLAMLYIEILKSTHTARTAAVNHSLSVLVLVVCILEFVLVARCGNSTFLMITLFAAVDVLAGFQVSIASARRDIEVERIAEHT